MKRSSLGRRHAGAASLALLLGSCTFGYPSAGTGSSAEQGAAGTDEPAGAGGSGELATAEGAGGGGGVDAPPVPDVPVRCAGAEEDCWGGLPCCPGTFCAYIDYAVTACVPAAPDGGPCGDDTGCLSGRCGGGSCRASACAAGGGPCSQRVDEGCCEGFCTSDGSSYVDGVCAAPQPTGSYCEEPHWCQSLACVDWQCL